MNDEWKELEARCVSTIWLYIGDNVFNHVIDEESIPKLWEKLQFRRKLYRLKMEESGDLMKHMNKFDKVIDQLKKVDVMVEQEEKALVFLASLSDSYEVFVESLICRKDIITLEQAQVRR